MKKYNFFRPLMIILVAYLANNLTQFICLSMGVEQKAAENYGLIAMIIAAVITYMRLMKRK